MGAAKHDLETTYINEWAETEFAIIICKEIAQLLHQIKIDLVDINHVMKTGEVIHSDMIDSKGLWTVRGTTVDEVCIDLEVAVVSSEYEVELLQILEVKRS